MRLATFPSKWRAKSGNSSCQKKIHIYLPFVENLLYFYSVNFKSNPVLAPKFLGQGFLLAASTLH
jgi:hypothetical protein